MSYLSKTYSKANGFSAITEDELYYINGGYDTNQQKPTYEYTLNAGVQIEFDIPGVEAALAVDYKGRSYLNLTLGIFWISQEIPTDASIQDITALAYKGVEKLKEMAKNYKPGPSGPTYSTEGNLRDRGYPSSMDGYK